MTLQPSLTYQPGSARVVAVDRQIQDRDVFLTEIKERLLQDQDYMKQRRDKLHRAVHFEVGDWVWLRLHHCSAVGITNPQCSKLAPRFYSPFLSQECIGSVAYRLHLPAKARIHNVFYVALRKPYQGPIPTVLGTLPEIVHGRVVPSPLSL